MMSGRIIDGEFPGNVYNKQKRKLWSLRKEYEKVVERIELRTIWKVPLVYRD